MLPVRCMKRAAKLACMIAGAAAAVLAFSLCASAENVTLSQEQTAALYLRNASAKYYAKQSDGTFTEYNLAWEILNTPTITGNGDLFISGAYGDNASFAQSYATAWGNSDYVFVRLKWPTASGIIPPVQSTNNYIKIDFDLSLTGISGFYGNVLLTCGNYNRPSNNTSWAVVGRSEYQYYTSTGIITQNTPVGTGGRPYRILTGLSQTAGLIPDDDKLYMYGSSTSVPIIDSSSPADLSSLSVVWRSPCAWGYFDHTNYDTIPSFVIAIRTPQIYGYTPPVTTPAITVATTRREYSVLPPQSTAPAHTVDLSNLESGVAAIVQQELEINNNLEWIGYNVMGGVNNLAYICNRLDDIYRDMVKSGQIPVNLFPMDGTFMNDIQNGLTSYTTARIPTDAAAGLTFWAWFMGKIMEQAWISELAALGSCLAVTYFVLFRGRNS